MFSNSRFSSFFWIEKSIISIQWSKVKFRSSSICRLKLVAKFFIVSGKSTFKLIKSEPIRYRVKISFPTFPASSRVLKMAYPGYAKMLKILRFSRNYEFFLILRFWESDLFFREKNQKFEIFKKKSKSWNFKKNQKFEIFKEKKQKFEIFKKKIKNLKFSMKKNQKWKFF